MSRWQTNFQSQEALQKIQYITAALQKVNLDTVNSTERTEYERAIKVLKLLEARFSTLDPELFGINTWGNFSQWLQNAQTYVGQVPQNHVYLQHLNNTLDEILNILRPLDVKFSNKELKALTEAGAVYRQKLVEELELVKKRADEIKKEYDQFANEITQGKTRLDRNDQIIETQKTRLDTSIAEFQQQFSNSQEIRNQESLKLIDKISEIANNQITRFDAIFKGYIEAQRVEASSVIEKSKQDSTEYLAYLEKRKKEVDEIFGAIGSASMAGNFNEIANEERKSADNWRIVAFYFMIAMGLIAIAAFAFTLIRTPDWETFLFRIGTVLVIAVPAFYAANESSKHREREKLIRKNFLELSAIDAYLVHLPEEERNEIKGKLSEKFFGVPELHEKTDSVSKKDLFSLVEKLVKDFTKGH